MSTAYLSLGANLGNKRQQLLNAITRLTEMAGNIPAISDFYETTPWGYSSPNSFLNAAVQLETLLSPIELLTVTQQIEHELGRTTKSNDHIYTDRTIDIDILMYGELILQSPDLILPHPFMRQRLFVLQPLAEIAPNLLHPVFNKTIAVLYNEILSICL